jgi:hypothetical protein
MPAACYLPDLLPPEITRRVLEYAKLPDLAAFGAASRLSYEYATDFIWKDLILRDQYKEFDISPEESKLLRNHTIEVMELDEDSDGDEKGSISHKILNCNLKTELEYQRDEHDDTPIIKKCITLVKKPQLAAKVRTLTLSCHMPAPDIFEELAGTVFCAQSLSSDWRTIELLRLAILNMVNVHTLRLSFPHYNLARTALHDFFYKNRPRHTPIRRLWLESCDVYCDNLYEDTFDMEGLQSIRVRRLKTLSSADINKSRWGMEGMSRSGARHSRRDGAGGRMDNYVMNSYYEDQHRPRLHGNLDFRPIPQREVARCSDPGSIIFDKYMFEAIPEVESLLESHQAAYNSMLPPLNEFKPLLLTADELDMPMNFDSNDLHLLKMLRLPFESLTHLNIDWLIGPFIQNGQNILSLPSRYNCFLSALSHLRFKHLKTFQLRNAISPGCEIPSHVFLLHPVDVPMAQHPVDAEMAGHPKNQKLKIDFLSFLESHQNLVCLAWPMEYFLPSNANPDYTERIQQVIENLGNTLETLRVDVKFSHNGEKQTGERGLGQRSRFICDIASRMRKVKTIKMEVSKLCLCRPMIEC